ncbi:MAG TPA: hypothetical protein VKA31_11335 [Mariprofundaceae bacterium]|nr:hypothetical protein [Mariprofundaceae bacterium]
MSFFSAIGGILDVGTTLLGIGGASQEASANEEAQKYRAAVARNNKQIALAAAQEAYRRGQLTAQDAVARGIQQEANLRSSARQLVGQQRAGLGASGALIDAGSGGDIQANTAGLAELQALTIRSNTDRAVRDIQLSAADARAQYLQKARDYEATAGLAERGAVNAQVAGAFNIGQTLLSGASSVASKWYNYNSQGGDFWSFG